VLLPAHGVRAADFSEPMVRAWQMMDAMRQMMEWFIGGSNRNHYRNPSIPFGAPYPTPYGTNFSALNRSGFNRYSSPSYRHYPTGSEIVVAVPREGEGEWLRDPIPYDENFWGDDPYWDSGVVPLGAGYPASRSGYEGIDGIWLVNTGERWQIQGNQFVLRKSNGTIIKGEFTIKDDWIVVHHYDSNMTISLQFRQMDDLLVIRDRSGAVVLLHRLPEFHNPLNYDGYYQ